MPLNQPRLMQHIQNRDGEVTDMNGQQRTQSPAAAAASPGNKRVRLDNGTYEPVGNGRGAPQGVPQGGAAQNASSAVAAHQMLVENGINPGTLSAHQFAAFQGQPPSTQQRSIQLYAQSMATATGKNIAQLQNGPKGMPQNPGQAGSPMMPQTSEGGLGGTMNEFYSTPGTMRAGGLGGTHALQDYQMQLMQLEQQNKKRLMMARQEQDSIATHGGANRPDYHQGMSPNSRAAPSPGPGGKQTMSGTPKMTNQVGPGSPLPDGQMGSHLPQRNSPASVVGFNGQMTDGNHPMMYSQMGNGAVPNGVGMMRPPGFDAQMAAQGMTQMNPNLRVQAGRGQPVGPGGNPMWHSQQQQQQMQAQAQQQAQLQAQAQQQAQQQQAQQQAQQQQQQQPPQGQQPGQPQGQPPQQAGTPQPGRPNLPHTAMPPPQAPPNPANTGRPASASPQVNNNQPPTPTQSNKANPKGKAPRGEAAGKKVP